jgi:hypothetical protein
MMVYLDITISTVYDIVFKACQDRILVVSFYADGPTSFIDHDHVKRTTFQSSLRLIKDVNTNAYSMKLSFPVEVTAIASYSLEISLIIPLTLPWRIQLPPSVNHLHGINISIIQKSFDLLDIIRVWSYNSEYSTERFHQFLSRQFPFPSEQSIALNLKDLKIILPHLLYKNDPMPSSVKKKLRNTIVKSQSNTIELHNRIKNDIIVVANTLKNCFEANEYNNSSFDGYKRRAIIKDSSRLIFDIFEGNQTNINLKRNTCNDYDILVGKSNCPVLLIGLHASSRQAYLRYLDEMNRYTDKGNIKEYQKQFIKKMNSNDDAFLPVQLQNVRIFKAIVIIA